MKRLAMKKEAKAAVAGNRRYFTQIFILYFCALLLSESISSLLDYIFLGNCQMTLLAQTISMVVTIFLSAPILLLFYQSVFLLRRKKRAGLNFGYAILSIRNKDFLKKAFSLGVILCAFTVPLEMINKIIDQFYFQGSTNYFQYLQNIQNVQDAWPILLSLLTSFVSLIITFLLDLTYCIAALNPTESAGWAAKKSAEVIAENFIQYLVFILSFLPWYFIVLAGYILILVLTKYFQQTYMMSTFVLVFSYPLMMGIGFYFWPYYNAAKAILCKQLMHNYFDDRIKISL